MVFEVVHIVAQEGEADGLTRDYQAALNVVMDHPGSRMAWVARQREDTNAFALCIEWDSVDAHEDFRGSDLLQEFRKCVGGRVESAFGGHYDVIASS